MRARLEHRVRRLWGGPEETTDRILSAALLPASILYGGLTALRNMAWDQGLLRPNRVGAPVISVGNLAVGGTGKTPVSGWLVRLLLEAGFEPALVARGYGEDELRLHRRWNPGAPVVAHRDRTSAARQARAGGADCVVLDDGFQHRRLERDLDIVLLAAEHMFPGSVLPRGRYREPASALDRADVVAVTRRVAPGPMAEELVEDVRARHPHLLVVRLELVPAGWMDLAGEPSPPPEGEVMAVTSVAGPEAFAALVRERIGEDPELLAFPDHHAYDAADAERIQRAAGPRTVVTTEKDAVKLLALARLLPECRVLGLEVRPGPGADALLARVLSVARGRRSAGSEAASGSETGRGGAAPHRAGEPGAGGDGGGGADVGQGPRARSGRGDTKTGMGQTGNGSGET